MRPSSSRTGSPASARPSGFADLGDTARQAEAAITAYKLESTADLRQAAVSRICKLMGLIETTCAENDDCRA